VLLALQDLKFVFYFLKLFQIIKFSIYTFLVYPTTLYRLSLSRILLVLYSILLNFLVTYLHFSDYLSHILTPSNCINCDHLLLSPPLFKYRSNHPVRFNHGHIPVDTPYSDCMCRRNLILETNLRREFRILHQSLSQLHKYCVVGYDTVEEG
jgi:hypothetical protein